MATNNALNVQGPTPAFRVKLSADKTNVTGDSTTYVVPFDTSIFDTTLSFNTSTYTFTAPIEGMYLFNFSAKISNLNEAHTNGIYSIKINSYKYSLWEADAYASLSNEGVISGSFLWKLSIGDVIRAQIKIENGPKLVSVLSDEYSTYFSGSYIITI